MNKFITIIVPKELQVLAQTVCTIIGREAGQGMFTTGLSSDINQEPTHYISSGMIGPEAFSLLFDSTALTSALNGLYSFTEIDNLLSSSDITQEEPFLAMERLGLVISLY